MGTKFAHISILDATTNEAKELLEHIPRKKPISPEKFDRMKRLIFPDSANEPNRLQRSVEVTTMINKMISNMEFYIGRNGRLVL